MRFLVGGMVVVFNMLDNATTFLCLRAPVSGFEVFEANPLARSLFDGIGLVEGLLVESVLTTSAVIFLVVTRRIPRRIKVLLLGFLALLPAWAVANNMQVMLELGIPFPMV